MKHPRHIVILFSLLGIAILSSRLLLTASVSIRAQDNPQAFIREHMKLAIDACPTLTQKILFQTVLMGARKSPQNLTFDANGDGIISVTDAILLSTAMMGVQQGCMETATSKSSAPVCGDGKREGNEICDAGAENGMPCNTRSGSCTYCSTDCSRLYSLDPTCSDAQTASGCRMVCPPLPYFSQLNPYGCVCSCQFAERSFVLLSTGEKASYLTAACEPCTRKICAESELCMRLPTEGGVWCVPYDGPNRTTPYGNEQIAYCPTIRKKPTVLERSARVMKMGVGNTQWVYRFSVDHWNDDYTVFVNSYRRTLKEIAPNSFEFTAPFVFRSCYPMICDYTNLSGEFSIAYKGTIVQKISRVPTIPICGNGIVEKGEECEHALSGSLCHGAVAITNEECVQCRCSQLP